MTKDYAENLELFVRDIRDALKQPVMPVAVVELGGQTGGQRLCNELSTPEARTLHVRIVRPWAVVGIDVDNVTRDFSRMQYFKGIAQSVGRCTMSTASIAHENLNSIHII